MPRFVVQRTFAEGLDVIPNENGVKVLDSIIAKNATKGVTWVRSYVTRDKSRTYCIYDAPSAEAIREAAELTGLPVDTVHEVRVLDPYFFF
jgi:uncharacterized protein DUF4242